MKKQYSLSLLVIGIGLLLFQIVSFVIQNTTTGLMISIAYQFDTIFFFVAAFLLITQFKSFESIVMTLLLIYGGINIIYSLNMSNYLYNMEFTLEQEIFFTIGLLIAHIGLVLGVLFTLLHFIQKRFDQKFTTVFVSMLLSISLIMFLIGGIIVSDTSLLSIIRLIIGVITQAILYLAVIFLVLNREKIVEVKETIYSNSKFIELENLYKKGLITKEEFEERKEKLGSE